MYNFIIISLISFLSISLAAMICFRQAQRTNRYNFPVFVTVVLGGTIGALPLFLFADSPFYLLRDISSGLFLCALLLVAPGLYLLRQNRIEGHFLTNLFLQVICYLPLSLYIFASPLPGDMPLTSPPTFLLSFLFFLFVINSLELFEALGPFNNMLPAVLSLILSLTSSFSLVLAVPLGIFAALFVLDVTSIKIKGVIGLRIIAALCLTLFAVQEEKLMMISAVLVLPGAYLAAAMLHGLKYLVQRTELNFNIFLAVKNKITFRMYMLSLNRWKFLIFFGFITFVSVSFGIVIQRIDLHLQIFMTCGLIIILLVFLYILHIYFNFLEDSLGPAHQPDHYIKCQRADLREMVPLDRMISYSHLVMTRRRGGPRYFSFVSSRRFQKGQLISCDYDGDEKNLLVIWVGIPRGPEDRHVTGCLEMYM